MNPVSVDVKDILESAGIGLTFGTNLFIGKEPNSPMNCATIFDTPGGPDAITMGSNAGEIYQYPSIQIRVRNAKYLDGWNMIEQIKNTLHGRAHETINGTYYSIIYCSSGPAMLDVQEGVFRFIVNFNVQRR